jgi:hypothetical protein
MHHPISVERRIQALFLVGIILFISSCSPAPTTPTAAYTKISEATLKAGDAIPVPGDKAILTVTGKIGAANMPDGSIHMDLKTIESVGVVEMKVKDPFDNKDNIFRGVLMSDLMAVWKVPADATEMEMIALNDYVITIPISDFKTWPVVFALQKNGEYMPVSTLGPAMIVYPYSHFEFDREIFDNRWIWQVKSIAVK